LTRLREMLADEAVVRAFRTDERTFTRMRKLPFERVVGLLLSGGKMSLFNRVNRFFYQLGQLNQRPSASAFCQARRKVKPELFTRMNEEMVACLFEDYAKLVQRWNGRLVWAVDGTVMNLPDTPETREHYSVQINQHDEKGAVQGMASFLYDVLNEVTISVGLDAKRSEKSFVFNEHSPYFRHQAVVLYDRLYADYSVMAFHASRGEDFVIRAPLSHTFKAVVEFVRSKETDKVVTLNVSYKQSRFVQQQGLPNKIKVRLVKVMLDSGTLKVLMSSLLNGESYPAGEFKGLYEKRWGIETYFNRLKNLLEVERFSSNKLTGIEQDFYGIVFLATLASVLSKEEDEKAKQHSQLNGLKYSYKVNRSVCYLALVDHVLELLLNERKTPEQAEQELKMMFAGVLIPERPGRQNERRRRLASHRLRFQRYGKRIWA